MNITTGLCGTLLALSLAAPARPAAHSMDGMWRAGFSLYGQRCAIELIMNAGHYSELVRCGGLLTLQSGTYTVSGGMVFRTVCDFEPKYRYLVDVHRHGRLGGHYEPNAKPPGGSFRVSFTSPDAMRWQDAVFGGTLEFVRVPLPTGP